MEPARRKSFTPQSVTVTKLLNQVADAISDSRRWNEGQEQSIGQLRKLGWFKPLKNKLFGHDLNLVTQ